MSKEKEVPVAITDSELIEALISISIVAKSLAKKVMLLSLKKEGGEDDGKKRSDSKNQKVC